MADNDALVLVLSRNAFYKRLHFLALGAFVLTLFVIGLLASLFIYLWRYPTHPIYFAADNVGRLIKIIPVTTPNMTLNDIVNWTVAGVQAAFSYDYINYRSQLQGAQKYFTNFGWSNYMSALQASNNIVALTQRKQIVVAQVVAPPKLVAQGILNGSYAWKFELPLLVTYMNPPYDDKSKFANPVTVTVVVQRQPVLSGYKGLGIVQVVASMAVTAPTQPQEISNTPTG